MHSVPPLLPPLQVTTLEMKTNLLAAYVTAGLAAQLPELMRQLGIKPRDSFEIAFNRACGLAEAGDTEGAEAAVKAAYKQGETHCGLTNADDLAVSASWRCCMLVCVTPIPPLPIPALQQCTEGLPCMLWVMGLTYFALQGVHIFMPCTAYNALCSQTRRLCLHNIAVLQPARLTG